MANKIVLSRKNFSSLFDILFDTLHINFFAIDKAGYYIYKNNSLTHIVKETQRADKVDAKAWRSSLRVIETGKNEIIEEYYKNHWYLSFKAPLIQKDHILGVIGISIDITAQKEKEKVLKRAEANATAARTKAQTEEELRKTVMVLVGDIVHDLRTPIATIRTAANILHTLIPKLLTNLDPKQFSKKEWDYLQRNAATTAIKNSVTLMDAFINTTLSTLTTAQAAHTHGLSKKDLTKCSSRRVLENALDAFPFPEHIPVHPSIAYDFDFMGNPILMIKILFNIFRNAVDQIQSHAHGEISILTEQAGDFNTISIKDTAGGASADVVAHLFDGYFSSKKEGTGVGLAFCKQMMLSFGGDITCDAVEGDWMMFTLSFPKM